MQMLYWAIFVLCVYHQSSNISWTLVGNKIVDHSDVVGALPVDATPSAFLFWTKYLALMNREKTTTRREDKHLGCEIWCVLYWKLDGNYKPANEMKFSRQTCNDERQKAPMVSWYTWIDWFSSPKASAYIAYTEWLSLTIELKLDGLRYQNKSLWLLTLLLLTMILVL